MYGQRRANWNKIVRCASRCQARTAIGAVLEVVVALARVKRANTASPHLVDGQWIRPHLRRDQLRNVVRPLQSFITCESGIETNVLRGAERELRVDEPGEKRRLVIIIVVCALLAGLCCN